MCVCLGQMLRILVGLFGFVLYLSALGTTVALVGRVINNPVGFLSAILLMAVAFWYHLLRVRIDRIYQFAGPVWTLNWLLGPITVAGVASMAYGVLQLPEGNRLAMAYLTSVAIVYWGVFYVCSKATYNDISVTSAVVIGVSGGMRNPNPPKRVMIEGNICASKTTVCKALQTYVRARVTCVPENVHHTLLEAFNKDPAAYGFTFQLVMRERRDAVIKHVMRRQQREVDFLIVDRSLLGDWAFALWNYMTGSVTTDQMEIYRDAYGRTPCASFTDAINDVLETEDDGMMIICLLCTPAGECYKRLAERNGVDQETPLDYLLGVSMTHYMVLVSLMHDRHMAKRLAVYLLSGNNKFDTREECVSFLNKLDKRTNTVLFGQGAPGGDSEATIVPDTEVGRTRYVEICKMLGIDRIKPKQPTEEAWRKLAMEWVKRK